MKKSYIWEFMFDLNPKVTRLLTQGGTYNEQGNCQV